MHADDSLTMQYHRSPLGEWSVALRRPHPALRQHVSEFWHGSGRVAYQRDRILPRARSYLLINLGPPQYLVLPGPPEVRVVFDDLWYSGLYEGPLETEAPDGSVLLGVSFNATGAAALLPWSQAELANRTGPLEDLVGARVRELRERLLECDDIATRMRLVEDWLLDTCVTGRNVHPLVHWAMHRIADSRGQVRAEQLARDAGCSRKHLTGVFARQVGLPPKSLAQITRFQHAMQRLRRDGPVDWCEVAFECGYYDQSHLIREFHRYSGMAPGAFARAGKPDPGSVVVR